MKQLFILSIVLGFVYSSIAQNVSVDSIKVEKLEEVLVQAIRVNADSPVTHSNMSKEEIAKRNLGIDIPYLLNYLPSVVTTSDAGAGIGYTYMRVRGSDASRVNVTLNGIPFNDSDSQGTFWVDLPDFASSTENLQLQRGVGTSTNGSGAFGASLNILSDAVSESAFGEIGSSFGSYNTRNHHLKFSTGMIKENIEIAGRLSSIKSDGYIDRASSDLKSYFLQGAFVNDNTLIKALFFGGREQTYQAWNGIDEITLENDRTYNSAGMYTDDSGTIQFYDNEIDNYSQDHIQILWGQRFDNSWQSNFALNYTYGRGYFEQYKEDEDFAFYDFQPIKLGGEIINTTDLIRRRWLNNNFYVANANVNYQKDKIDVIMGLYYSYYGGDHFGEVIWARYASNSEIRDRYYSGNSDKNEFTTFIKLTYRFNDTWTVFGDLQGRFISYRTSGLTSDRVPLEVDEKYEFFNPKTGLSYDVNDANQLYISYGRAHREPRRSDFEQGIFKPEQLDDYELGWRYSSEKTQLSTNVYYMDYKDQLVLTGQLDDVGAPIRMTSGKSYRLGLEIDSDITILESLKIRPNIALSRNNNRDFISQQDGELVNLGTTNISFSPEIVFGNIIEYQPIKHLYLAFLSKYVGEQYMGNIDSDVSKLESYFIHDFNVVYTLYNIPYVREIVFSGLVNNLFNQKYVSNGYFYTYDDDFSNPGTITTVEGAGYYPQASTNFLIGATIKF